MFKYIVQVLQDVSYQQDHNYKDYLKINKMKNYKKKIQKK